jgi:glycosyltransferase involved in cell wall biosynthesis
MRIVHIVFGKVNPDSLNGVSKVVHWMATTQTEQGHDVEVWGLVRATAPSKYPRKFKLRLFSITRLRLSLGAEIKAALHSLGPGTWVQFHSVFCPEFPAIARQLTRLGFQYGVTPHGGYAPGIFRKNPLRKRLYFFLREAGYLRKAAWIQAIGATEVDEILRLAPAARVVLIPNCQAPLPANVVAMPTDAKRPLIGYCGRLTVQQKGLDLLISGFAEYKSRGGNGQLWLIGDGEERAGIEKLAVRAGVESHVRFLGAKHGEEKLSLIASFDAFIHPSRWDVIPTACLEAASLGRPLVVSRETNLGQYVEQSGAGLVLDELSAAAVSWALDNVQRLYDSGALKDMGRKAHLLVESEFIWEKNARSFVAAIAACGHAI